MKINSYLVAVALLLGAAAPPVGADPAPRPLTDRSDLALPTVAGESFSLSAMKGRPVFLYFFDPTSDGAVGSLGNVRRLQKETTDQGLEFVAVATGTADECRKLVEERDWQYDFPLVCDANGSMAQAFGATGEVSYAILGRDGTVRHSRSPSDWQHNEADLAAALEREDVRLPDTERLPVGTPAPDFSVETPDGGEASLSDFKGKVVLLEFWATWCPPCRGSFPELRKIHQDYGPKGLEMVSVVTTDSRENFQKFAAEHTDLWTLLYDPAPEDQSVGYAQYNISGFPTFFVIGADGRVVGSFKGWVGPVAAREIRVALEEAGFD